MFSGSISDGPHSITHGDACFAYFIEICGIPFRLIISLNLACSKIYHASGEGMPMLLISSRRTQHLLQVCCSQKSISLVLDVLEI